MIRAYDSSASQSFGGAAKCPSRTGRPKTPETRHKAHAVVGLTNDDHVVAARSRAWIFQPGPELPVDASEWPRWGAFWVRAGHPATSGFRVGVRDETRFSRSRSKRPRNRAHLPWAASGARRGWKSAGEDDAASGGRFRRKAGGRHHGGYDLATGGGVDAGQTGL